jgi:hypothetical protein
MSGQALPGERAGDDNRPVTVTGERRRWYRRVRLEATPDGHVSVNRILLVSGTRDAIQLVRYDTATTGYMIMSTCYVSPRDFYVLVTFELSKTG